MMHDAWSMFHSQLCIKGVSFCKSCGSNKPSDQTDATDTTMLCQQNINPKHWQKPKPLEVAAF